MKNKIIILLFSLITTIITFSITSKKNVSIHENDLRKILVKDNSVKKALFNSKDNITQILIEMIKHEKKSIKASIYLITDRRVCKALIEAKKRNVNVEFITCHSKLNHIISQLYDNNIDIYFFGNTICVKKKFINQSIMHNKFFIFEQNLDDRRILWTGSFNLTWTAQAKNKENVLLLDDKSVVLEYIDEFERIKKQSKLFVKNDLKAITKQINTAKPQASLFEKFKQTFHLNY